MSPVAHRERPSPRSVGPLFVTSETKPLIRINLLTEAKAAVAGAVLPTERGQQPLFFEHRLPPAASGASRDRAEASVRRKRSPRASGTASVDQRRGSRATKTKKSLEKIVDQQLKTNQKGRPVDGRSLKPESSWLTNLRFRQTRK